MENVSWNYGHGMDTISSNWFLNRFRQLEKKRNYIWNDMGNCSNLLYTGHLQKNKE